MPTVFIRPGQGTPLSAGGDKSKTKRLITRCKQCGREVMMAQEEERHRGRVGVVMKCTHHGTLMPGQFTFSYEL